MAVRLIINADDFGLTPGINRSIADLHHADVVTSATLMAAGPAFEDAVALARSLPGLGIGCHIVLTDGKPVSPPREIPTLLGPDRLHFRPSLLHFAYDLLRGTINATEIRHEAAAQLEKLEQAGIAITHVDTHKHTHLLPRVAATLLNLLTRTSIGAIRNPFEPRFARCLPGASYKRRLQLSLLSRFKPAFDRLAVDTLTTDGTIGIAATGRLDRAALQRLLAALPSTGLFELVCHPGYNDADLDRIATRLRSQRDTERKALLSEVLNTLSLPNPPQLIHYGDLEPQQPKAGWID